MIKNPYLFLIDKCLEKLTHKYNTSFKSEIEREGLEYKFTIYQNNNLIFSKNISVSDDTDMIDYVQYEILNDFFINAIDSILIQNIIKEGQIKIIRGSW